MRGERRRESAIEHPRRMFVADSQPRQRRFQLEARSAPDCHGTLAAMLDAHGFREIGVARVAEEGRQWYKIDC